jgi:hypothetical protein
MTIGIDMDMCMDTDTKMAMDMCTMGKKVHFQLGL